MKATHEPAQTPVSDPMRPSMLLRGAAIYLGTHGHTQGQFFDLLANTDGPFAPACASGAILSAACGTNLGNSFFAEADDDPQIAAALQAMRVLADHLNDGYIPLTEYPVSPIDVIGDWNDEQGRTLTEVIETLMDAANGWETTHHTGGTR